MLTLNPLEKLATNFSTPGFAEGFCQGQNIPILEKRRKTDDQTASLNWISSTSHQRTGWFFETNAFLSWWNKTHPQQDTETRYNQTFTITSGGPHRPKLWCCLQTNHTDLEAWPKKRVGKSWGNFLVLSWWLSHSKAKWVFALSKFNEWTKLESIFQDAKHVGEQVSCPVGLQEIIHKLNGTPGPWWKRSGSCYCLLWLLLVVVILLALNWSCYTVLWVNKPYLVCLFKWTTAWLTVVLARQKLQEAVRPEKRFLLSNFLKVSCNELFSSLFPFSNSSRQKSTKTSIYIDKNQHLHFDKRTTPS